MARRLRGKEALAAAAGRSGGGQVARRARLLVGIHRAGGVAVGLTQVGDLLLQLGRRRGRADGRVGRRAGGGVAWQRVVVVEARVVVATVEVRAAATAAVVTVHVIVAGARAVVRAVAAVAEVAW
eukprot:scaffold1245_cov59-Phaeocystis_antarctica.AAC.3